MRCFKDGEIYGNLLYTTEAGSNNTGIFFHTDGGPVPYPSNTKVYNNTFVNDKPYYTLYNESFRDLTIRNNIFVSTYGGNSQPIVKMAYTTGVTMDYDVYYGNTTAINWGGTNMDFSQLQGTSQEQHGYFSDPQLDSNCKPIQTSFVRNKGFDLGAPWNYDMDGHLRGADGYWDIGAYEYYDPSGIKDSHQNIKNEQILSTIVAGPLQLPQGKKVRVFDVTGRIVKHNEMIPGVYVIEVEGKIIEKIVRIK